MTLLFVSTNNAQFSALKNYADLQVQSADLLRSDMLTYLESYSLKVIGTQYSGLFSMKAGRAFSLSTQTSEQAGVPFTNQPGKTMTGLTGKVLPSEDFRKSLIHEA